MEERGYVCYSNILYLNIAITILLSVFFAFLIAVSDVPSIVIVLAIAAVLWNLCTAIIPLSTRYYISERGIKTSSLLKRYSRQFTWEAISKIEIKELRVGSRSRSITGNLYYLIATSQTVQWGDSFYENMSMQDVIVLPMTKKLRNCLEFYCLRHASITFSKYY